MQRNLVLHIPLGNVLFQKYSFFYINLQFMII